MAKMELNSSDEEVVTEESEYSSEEDDEGVDANAKLVSKPQMPKEAAVMGEHKKMLTEKNNNEMTSKRKPAKGAPLTKAAMAVGTSEKEEKEDDEESEESEEEEDAEEEADEEEEEEEENDSPPLKKGIFDTPDLPGEKRTATITTIASAPASGSLKRPAVKQLVDMAIKALNERSGSSLVAIKKYIFTHYADLDEKRYGRIIKMNIKKALNTGRLLQTKGKGMAGSFKIAPIKEKGPSKKVKADIKKKKPNTKIQELGEQEQHLKEVPKNPNTKTKGTGKEKQKTATKPTGGTKKIKNKENAKVTQGGKKGTKATTEAVGKDPKIKPERKKLMGSARKSVGTLSIQKPLPKTKAIKKVAKTVAASDSASVSPTAAKDKTKKKMGKTSGKQKTAGTTANPTAAKRNVVEKAATPAAEAVATVATVGAKKARPKKK